MCMSLHVCVPAWSVCVYVWECVSLCISACLWLCVCVHLHQCAYVCFCMCIYLWVCVCMYVTVGVCMCLCMCVYVCFCECVSVCVCVCLHMCMLWVCVCVCAVWVWVCKSTPAWTCWSTLEKLWTLTVKHCAKHYFVFTKIFILKCPNIQKSWKNTKISFYILFTCLLQL